MAAETGSLLLVDDHEVNSSALGRILTSHGHRVMVGNSGVRALELAGQHRFDLVLLDIMMAGMNGLEVLTALRGRHSVTDLPIIMTTALGASEDIVEALKLGASDYVTKPIDLPVLLARIQTQLALKRAVERSVGLEQSLSARNDELEAANRQLRDANRHMKRDLAAAARIQKAFLPTEQPRLNGVEFSWIFRPCEQLAGDMLNVFPLDDDHLGMYVLDVSGHGVAAALLSVTLSHLLSPRRDPSSLLIQCSEDNGARIVPPAEVVELLNKRFPWDPATEQFFTLIYGVLNVSTGTLRYVNAGHPGPVHAARGALPILLEKPSLPVGVGDGGYKEQALQLRPGDRLFLYSDGLVEAVSDDGTQFGKRRLLEAIGQGRDDALRDNLAGIWQEVERWRGTTPRRDDVSLLALQFTGRPAAMPDLVAQPRRAVACTLPA